MGVMYHVWPASEAQVAQLLAGRITLPDVSTPSRNPTPSEIRAVAAGMTDLKVTVWSPPEHKWWQVSFDGFKDPRAEPWTVLNVSDFSGDEAAPHEISFEKGWPSLILRIVHALVAITGPLVIFPDNDCEAIVVRAGDDPQALRESWKHQSGVGR